MGRNNPYGLFIRTRYRSKGLHQKALAAFLGVEEGSVSKYLNGYSRTNSLFYRRICEWLHLSSAESEWLWLVHELVHADPVVQRYVQLLEAHQWTAALCDKRLEKLGAVVDDLRMQREALDARRPVFPKGEGSSGERKAVSGKGASVDDDDESASSPGTPGTIWGDM